MNSWVLKPCRCVVFFVFIPKAAAPSGSGFRRCGGFATLTRLRVNERADCDGLRLAREEVFVFRLMPVALFFGRRRVFSATALAWNSRLFLRFLGNSPKKYAPSSGSGPRGCYSLSTNYISHYSAKIKALTPGRKPCLRRVQATIFNDG